MRPVPHSEEYLVPKFPDFVILSGNSDFDSAHTEDERSDPTFEASSSSEPHFFTQEDLNDLTRDLNLFKQSTELLSSWLKGWNLLQKDTRICTYQSRTSLKKTM